MKTLFTIHLVVLLSASSVLACEAAPPEQIVPATELVKRTKTILLARVTSAIYNGDSDAVIYTFQSVKALKGHPEETFTISGVPLEWEGSLSNFNHHNDKAFWQDTGGRSYHSVDCEIHPSFSVGATFLIFLDKPYHNKSFELIIRTHGNADVRDKWLSWVESQTKAEPSASPNRSPATGSR